MFTTLVESGGRKARAGKSTTLSVVAHGALIAAAVWVSTSTQVRAAPVEKDPTILYVPVTKPAEPMHAQPMPRTPAPSAPTLNQIVIQLPPTIPTTIPPIDVDVKPLSGEESFKIGRGPSSRDNGLATGGPPLGEPNGVISAEQTDKAPFVLGNAPAPRYPSILRESGTTGHVTARFVVDTLGRMEQGSVTITESTHALFADAVKGALQSYRFAPGEVGGRKVRTLVQMPFTFSIDRGR